MSAMCERASKALTLGSIEWDPMYDLMLVKQDEVVAVLSPVRNTLDSLLLANSLVNEAAVYKFNISVGATSALPSDIQDDLWLNHEPVSLMIDLNNPEQSTEQLETEVGAVGNCAKGVTPQHLSKV